MRGEDLPVAVITGTIGVGKSTVAALASEILHDRGIRHGLIEVDWLEGVYPAPDPADPYGISFALGNLKAIWPNFLAAGVTRVLVTMTLENQRELDDLVATMGTRDATVVRLVASERTCRRRIAGREFGELRELFLEKTVEIERKMDRSHLGDIIVTNDDRLPTDTARDVLERLGWIPAER